MAFRQAHLREPVESPAHAYIIAHIGSVANNPPYKALSNTDEWQWRSSPVDIIDFMHCGTVVPNSIHTVTAIARPDRFL